VQRAAIVGGGELAIGFQRLMQRVLSGRGGEGAELLVETVDALDGGGDQLE
jgi:hypothetical protein